MLRFFINTLTGEELLLDEIVDKARIRAIYHEDSDTYVEWFAYNLDSRNSE